MQADHWHQPASLDGEPVIRIDSLLQSAGRIAGDPNRLAANLGSCFLGDQLNTLGFVLSVDEAGQLINDEAHARDVVCQYLSGEDLNTSPTQEPTRCVINFRDWPIERAERYPKALAIVRERARPDIELKGSKNYKGWSDRWWQFWMYKSALHRATDVLPRVIALAKVSKTVQPALVPTGTVFTDMVVVIALDDDGSFGAIASSFHYWWALTYASTMRTDVRYTPTDCFETFPRPQLTSATMAAGSALNANRSALMRERRSGLTKTYNRVHDAAEGAPEIVRLRELHVELDNAVRDAYGWSDLQLNHHHWETPQGMRFTVSPAAKDDLLDRLLEANHQRYAEEVAAGLHDKQAGKVLAKRAKAADRHQESLI